MSFAFPLKSEEAFKDHYKDLKLKYHDATHHCYALRIGETGSIERWNDDGEPFNSAGKSILRAIQSNKITDSAIIIVRYFGGVKLGIPGLTKAYHSAALEAIAASGILAIVPEKDFRLKCQLDHEGEAYLLLKKLHAHIRSVEYGLEIIILFSIPKSETGILQDLLIKFYQVKVEEA